MILDFSSVILRVRRLDLGPQRGTIYNLNFYVQVKDINLTVYRKYINEKYNPKYYLEKNGYKMVPMKKIILGEMKKNSKQPG